MAPPRSRIEQPRIDVHPDRRMPFPEVGGQLRVGHQVKEQNVHVGAVRYGDQGLGDGAERFAVDRDLCGQQAADAVAGGRCGGLQRELAAFAGGEWQGPGRGNLPPRRRLQPGGKGDRSLPVIAQHEAVLDAVAGRHGGQVGPQPGPEQVDVVVGRLRHEVAKHPFLARDEVRVLVELLLRAVDHVAVAGTDQLGIEPPHHLHAAVVHGELEAVAQHRGLVRLVECAARPYHLPQKEIVSRERHLAPVDAPGVDGVELGLTGCMADVERVLLPREAIAILQPAVDPDRPGHGAGRAGPGGGVLQHPRHLVQRPAPRAVVALQVGDATGVVVVNVSRHHQVEFGHAVVIAQLVEVVDHEAHALESAVVGSGVHVRAQGVTVVDEHRLARVAEHHVEVAARPRPAPQQVARQRLQPQVGQERCGREIGPHHAHPRPQVDAVAQPAPQPRDVSGDVGDRLAVGGIGHRHRPPRESVDRLDGVGDALHAAVGVLHRMELVEPAAGGHQVADESHFPPVDAGDQHRRPARMALRRHHLEAIAAPSEGLVVLQAGVYRHGAGRGEKSIAVVVVVVDAAGAPEQLRVLEQVALMLRHGDPRSGRGQAPECPRTGHGGDGCGAPSPRCARRSPAAPR